MQPLWAMPGRAWVELLGWTLVHSLWQGAALAGLLAIALAFLRGRSASSRYLAACLALAALPVLGATTVWYELARRESPPPLPVSKAPLSPAIVELPVSDAQPGASEQITEVPPISSIPQALPVDAAAGTTLAARIEPALPWLVLGWLIGVAILSLRLAIGLLRVQWLRRARVRPADPAWQTKLADISRKLGLRRTVGLLESACARAPMLAGHLRPAILLPASVMLGMSPAHIEAIIAHELAHVRRHDYLVNLVQSAVEVLFFYHPATWWMSACIRKEREHCCDDMAVQACGSPMDYARALLALTEIPGDIPRTALAAAGSRGWLFQRVSRLVQPQLPRASRSAGWLAGVVLLGAMATLFWGVRRAHAEEIDRDRPERVVVIDPHLTFNNSGWTGYAEGGSSDWVNGRQRLIVGDPESVHIWVRYLDLPIDSARYPVVALTYRARNKSARRPGQYILWLDVSSSDRSGGIEAIRNDELIDDGRVHEIRKDLRAFHAKGPIAGLALGMTAGALAPGTFELFSLRFEADAGPGPTTRPEDDAALRVAVTDESGRPLAGAAVTLDAERANFARGTLTDVQGQAVITPIGNETGGHMVRVEHAGYARMELRKLPAEGGPVRIQLYSEVAYGGWVEDESGKPIRGAVVDFYAFDQHLDKDLRMATSFTTITDDAGRWRSPPMPGINAVPIVHLFHPDFVSNAPLTVSAGTVPDLLAGKAVLAMEPGVTLAGRVLSEKGAPVAGALVRQGHDKFASGRVSPAARTDGRGGFRFDHSMPGARINLQVLADGFAPQARAVTPLPDAPAVEFTLAPARPIRGRMLDPQGRAMANIGLSAGAWSWSTRTDGDGRFVWPEPPAVGATIDIDDSRCFKVLGHPLAATDQEQVVTVMPALHVRGRVTDAKTGKAIANAQVMPGSLTPVRDPRIGATVLWQWEDAQMPGDGRYDFTFRGASPGQEIHAAADGYRSAVSRVVKDEEGQVTLDLQLEPAAEIVRGVVRTPDGTPAAGAILHVIDGHPLLGVQQGRFLAGYTGDQIKTDNNGRYSLAPPASAYTVAVVNDAGFARVDERGIAQSPDIALHAWARIEGLARAGNKPDARAQVSYTVSSLDFEEEFDLHASPSQRLFQGAMESTATDAQGRFVFEHVQPGAYKVFRWPSLPRGLMSIPQPAFAEIDVEAEKTLHLVLGGTGRPVIGRFTLPAGLAPKADRIFCDILGEQIRPKPPSFPKNYAALSPAEKMAWYHAWRQSDEGKEYVTHFFNPHYIAAAQADGSFRAEDIPAGNYILLVKVLAPVAAGHAGSAPQVGQAQLRFTVPPIPGGRSDEPLDVGAVPVAAAAQPSATAPAPARP